MRSGALPLSTLALTGGGLPPLVTVSDDGVGVASCHAGMLGLPMPNGRTGAGDAGALGNELLRLRSSALSDFSSCCSSASDCFSESLVFSIIWFQVLAMLIRQERE